MLLPAHDPLAEHRLAERITLTESVCFIDRQYPAPAGGS
jgi:hypothetical protein